MRVAGVPYRTLRVAEDGWSVEVIDQTRLPREFALVRLASVAEAARAIRDMRVRGAPLIGVTAAYGIALGARLDPSAPAIEAAYRELLATRPTAVNLRWALDRMRSALLALTPNERAAAAYRLAGALAEEDVSVCERIGLHGERVLRLRWEEAGRPERLRLLTHCNAGWLATIDWGTALAPVYRAHDRGLPLHIWVGETRPRNQGYLTAWELAQHGVSHTVVVDAAAGLLLRRGQVDLCVVGTDRTTRCGDVCNKIGTYPLALAARDNQVPFYAAVPSSSVDWTLADGMAVPIEERDPREVHPDAGVPVLNPAFDVTPARLVTGLITERGVCGASEEGLLALFPEKR